MAADSLLLQRGTLEMAAGAADVPAVQDSVWSDLLSNRILAVAAVLLILFNLREFISLVPRLVFSATRTNGFRTMEHNIRLSRTRNFAALCCILSFCLLADRYSLYAPQFLSEAPPQWRSPAIAGVFTAYILLRRCCSAAVRPRRMDPDSLAAVRNSPRSLFVLLTFTALASAGVLGVCRLSDAAIRTVLLSETAIFYLYSLTKTGQILAGHCGTLSTILYLCALEILPTAALVVSASVL